METKSERIQSLDALRGFDMFWIMGGGGIAIGLAQWTGLPIFKWFAEQQEHVAWQGFHFEDLIFPLFIFIAGVTMPFSILKRKERGESTRNIYKHLIKRVIILILLGFIYNQVHWFEKGNIRYASVLARIGISTFIAGLLVLNFSKRNLYIIFAFILLSYWAICELFAAPGFSSGDYTLQGNFAGYIDRLFLPGDLLYFDHLMDPEGLLSTYPSIASALLGVLTGLFLRDRQQLSKLKRCGILAVSGATLLGAALVWSLFFPIIKGLWTSTYVLFAGGLSLLFFALFYFIMDVKGKTSWAFFFQVIGMNSILSYLMQPMFAINNINDFFFTGVIKAVPVQASVLISSITYTGICWIILYFAFKKKIFLKI